FRRLAAGDPPVRAGPRGVPEPGAAQLRSLGDGPLRRAPHWRDVLRDRPRGAGRPAAPLPPPRRRAAPRVGVDTIRRTLLPRGGSLRGGDAAGSPTLPVLRRDAPGRRGA